jgi:hypothetical protein
VVYQQGGSDLFADSFRVIEEEAEREVSALLELQVVSELVNGFQI